jgi:hypothetical protein
MRAAVVVLRVDMHGGVLAGLVCMLPRPSPVALGVQPVNTSVNGGNALYLSTHLSTLVDCLWRNTPTNAPCGV